MQHRLLMVLQNGQPRTHIHHGVLIGPDMEILSYIRSLTEIPAMQQLSESVVDYDFRLNSQFIYVAAYRSKCPAEISHVAQRILWYKAITCCQSLCNASFKGVVRAHLRSRLVSAVLHADVPAA